MPFRWVKIDDHFTENAKIVDLHDRSFRLHFIGLCYCARNLTDGHLSPKQVKVVHAILGSTSTRWVADLVSAGLWSKDKRGGFVIKDFNEFNPPAAEVKEQRRRNAERQAKHRAHVRELKAQEDAQMSHMSHLRSQAKSQGVGNSAPSRPLKEPKPKGFTSYAESPDLELVRETISDALGDAA